jgi:hypothetical protein
MLNVMVGQDPQQSCYVQPPVRGVETVTRPSLFVEAIDSGEGGTSPLAKCDEGTVERLVARSRPHAGLHPRPNWTIGKGNGIKARLPDLFIHGCEMQEDLAGRPLTSRRGACFHSEISRPIGGASELVADRVGIDGHPDQLSDRGADEARYSRRQASVEATWLNV